MSSSSGRRAKPNSERQRNAGSETPGAPPSSEPEGDLQVGEPMRYETVPFYVCFRTIAAEQGGLSPEAAAFADGYYRPGELRPEVRDALEIVEPLLEDTTPYSRAICRGFVAKAWEIGFNDFLLIPVASYVVALWRGDDGRPEAANSVPEMPDFLYRRFSQRLVIPIVQRSRSERAMTLDAFAWNQR